MKNVLFSIVLLISLTTFASDINQTKEMSKADVDNWFKEYIKIEKESQALNKRLAEEKAKGKKLDKLNNTLDELNGILGVEK